MRKSVLTWSPLLTDRGAGRAMPRLGAAFMALLLLVTRASAVSRVSPPTDVSVRCQNMRVTLSWECGRRQQPTSFNVMIKGAFERLETETTECQYDLTSFLWGSESRYMDNYYVSVVAVEGGESSEAVLSQTFSFNSVKTVDVMCSLDFPPVDVKQKDSRVLARFANPFRLYPQLRGKFSFFISSNSSHFEASCSTDDETCKHQIHFAAGEEECVTLGGILFDRFGVDQIIFKKTERICKSEELNVLIYVVPLLVAVLIIAVVLAICCKVKAWIMKPAPLPGPLILDFGKQSQSYNHVSQTDVSLSRMMVMPSVSLKKEEEEEEEVVKLREPEPVHQGSSSSSSGGGGQDEYVVRSRPCSDYLDSGSDQMDTRSTSVCSDSGEEPAYDRPHVCVDLGDGEFADGYRE